VFHVLLSFADEGQLKDGRLRVGISTHVVLDEVAVAHVKPVNVRDEPIAHINTEAHSTKQSRQHLFEVRVHNFLVAARDILGLHDGAVSKHQTHEEQAQYLAFVPLALDLQRFQEVFHLSLLAHQQLAHEACIRQLVSTVDKLIQSGVVLTIASVNG